MITCHFEVSLKCTILFSEYEESMGESGRVSVWLLLSVASDDADSTQPPYIQETIPAFSSEDLQF